jgi:hypothetical protein
MEKALARARLNIVFVKQPLKVRTDAWFEKMVAASSNVL